MSIRLPRAAPAPPRPGLGDTGRAAAGRAGSFNSGKNEYVLLRTEGRGRTTFFSGPMSRLSRRLAGRRPPSPFLPFCLFTIRHERQNLNKLLQANNSSAPDACEFGWSYRPPPNSPPRRGAHAALRRPTQHGSAVSGASRQSSAALRTRLDVRLPLLRPLRVSSS